MSSDDEFGGYTPTNPARPPAPAKKAVEARQTRAAASVAGPSKPVPPTRGGRKTQKDVDVNEVAQEVEVTEVTEVFGSDDDEPEVIEKPVAKTKGKILQPRTARGTTKTFPRAKAGTRTKQPVEDVDAIAVDEVQSAEEDPAPQRVTMRNGRTSKPSKSNSTGPVRQSNEPDVLLREELEVLRREVEEATAQRETLTAQLEEAFRIRNTEAEELLAQQTAHYEARLQSQDDLLNEQSKLIAATTSNKPYTLHFLSREAADEEKKGLEQELARSQEIIKQKDAIIAEKDQRIRDISTEKDMLQTELNAEVERSKSLASRNPVSTTVRSASSKRGGMSDVADPKMSAVFTLYEDVTNLLVLKVKLERGTFAGTEEKVFDCIYSAPATDSGVGSSLHFNLRSLYEKNPDAHPSLPLEKQLIAKMQYEPLDLDKESPEYVERLDFFREPFLFQYDQLHVFLKSLVERFPQQTDNSEEEDADEEDGEAS